MSERYSEGSGDDAGTAPPPVDRECRALLARLLPGADDDLLVRALREEAARMARDGTPTAAAETRRDAELSPAERELRRVRTDLALGGSARMLQHSINNPLAALLAEAQLLELDAATDEQRVAAARIVELARRIAAVVRRLEPGVVPAPPPG